jgi:Coenzyme F390 synthetase
VTATRPPVRLVPAPASLPVAEIVRRLNAAQPPHLLAYAAKLAELAAEQRDGRLKLSLRSVTSMSEAISPAERAAVTEAFGVPVIDLFVSTEGLVGHSEPGGTVLTFAGRHVHRRVHRRRGAARPWTGWPRPRCWSPTCTT